MKSYDRVIIWLNYFNSELKRSEGRRVPLNASVRAPKLDELEEACVRLNLRFEHQSARFPSSVHRESGYVSVRKDRPKQKLVLQIGKELSAVRGESAKALRKV